VLGVGTTTLPSHDTPALFTITSSRPVAATAASTSAWTAAGSRTSATWYSAEPPAAAMRSAASFSAASVRPDSTTWAPAPPSRSATARPMPLEAPVTTAVRPVRSVSVMGRSSRRAQAKMR
jgi:hypothetical protein